MRGTFLIYMSNSSDPPSDAAPLSASFQSAECRHLDRPIGPDEPSPVLDGETLLELHPRLVERLDQLQPATAEWVNGNQTQVRVELGLPVSACEFTPHMAYPESGETRLDLSMPLRITSSDGRVKVRTRGSATVVYDPSGALERFVMSAGNDNQMIPVADFAARSGIEGVDLSGLTGAAWAVTMDVFRASESADSTLEIRGELDGRLTDWDTLSWRH